MATSSRDWLDYQADLIEALLASHKLEALVVGVQVSPRWIRYNLQLGLGIKISSVQNLSEELAMSLGVDAVRVARNNGVLAVEVPLPDPEPVYMLSLVENLPELTHATSILGLGVDGNPLILDLTAPEVTHVLVAGATGTGKTELLRTMLLSLALYNRITHVQMALIDPKRRGLGPLFNLPHLVAPVATSPSNALVLLQNVVDEMVRRDREDAPPLPRIVVAVDEVGDLLSIADKEVEQLLVRLAQRGREAGIHLICSTQRPSADAIPGALKANLPARLVGKVASSQEALMATGIPGTNAEQLTGAGDFLSIVGSKVQRFQAAYNDPLDIERIVEFLLSSPATDIER
ncbi:MAG: DNA translocase FtsK [Chloroflexi bacterium]|nr:DNA translocase FtsK [Chloroflexota bacterium]